MKKLNAVFMGTPEFSVPSLNALYNNKHINLKYVVSMPDRPSGRGHKLKSPEVIEFAKQNNIPFFQSENINREDSFLDELVTSDIDIIIVLAFAQFLGDKILNIPKIACFNIHTSLLPKYRGAAPIQYAILNGDKETGVSIQRMVKKMDAGDIAYSLKVAIPDNFTGGDLFNLLQEEAASSLNTFIEKLVNENITYTQQDESNVSFAPTIKRTDGALVFSNKTVRELQNQIRAFHPWPGTYCFLNGKRMKVFSIEASSFNLNPNEIKIDKGLFIGCKDGAVEITDVQLEGKKRCHFKDLLNGIQDKKNITITKE